MYLLVLVLNKTELLEKVLQNLMDIGIPGATIIDSTGAGRALAQADKDFITAGIRTIFQYSRPHNKTILSVIESREMLDRAIDAVKHILGDLSKPGVGILFSIRLEDARGIFQS